jgi:hypothetical protein
MMDGTGNALQPDVARVWDYRGEGKREEGQGGSC